MKNLFLQNNNTHKRSNLFRILNSYNKIYITANLIKGFTLTEILISTSIFGAVAVMGVSILFASQAIYKRISFTRNATDNLNFVMEAMTREIRTGTHYGCVNTVGNFQDPANSIKYNSLNFTYFQDSDTCNAIAFAPEVRNTFIINNLSVFYFNTISSSLNKVDYEKVQNVNSFNKIADYQITSTDLVITDFIVKVRGSGMASSTIPDHLQPSMSIFLSGIINQQKNQQGIVVSTSTFHLQSLASQRLLDQ